MAPGKASEDTVIRAAASALGKKDPTELASLGRKGFEKFTQKQLLECAKALTLGGVAKLGKEELAERVFTAVKTLLSPQPKPVSTKATKEPAKTNTPKPEKNQKKTLAIKVKEPEPIAEKGEPLTHKFEVGTPIKADEITTIPWAYNYDRVTGMAVDPEKLFVYWEVTDDGIEHARQHLHKGGKDAWLSLRIYDTTDRIFDGTNAHSYFDHKVERSDRHWFFQIGKPSSSVFVDIGLKSAEGYFVKITRSGRVEFPRREAVPWTEPEWLSVRSMWGPVEHAGRGPHIRRQAPGLSPTAASASPPSPGPRRHVALLPWEESNLIPEGERREITEWEEQFQDGHVEFHRQMYWESPVMVSAWEAGPFSHPVDAPLPHHENFVGPTRVYRVGGRTHVVYGPWQIVIRGLAARQGQALVARWEIFRSWIAEEKAKVIDGPMQEEILPGGSERRLQGASELLWRYGSQERLGGASELYYLGASELRAIGASERMFAGASQYTLRGASERRLGGASETRMKGASERMLGGSSEGRLGGASEHFLGGSEVRIVASNSEGSYPTLSTPVNEPEHKD